MKPMSSSLGSQSPLMALHSSSVSTSPDGLMRLPPSSPILRFETLVRLGELEVDAGLFDRLVPAVDSALAIDDEVVEQPRVEGA